MANFVDLRRQVYPYVSGCPEVIIEQAVSQAAREFFRQTQVWRETLPLDVVEGQTAYALPVHTYGTEAFIEEVVRVFRPMPNRQRDEDLYAVPHTSDLPNLGSRPIAFTSPRPDQLLLAPSPVEAETLQAEAVLVPTTTATSIPDHYYEPYAQALLHGAIYELKGQSGHPWFDPNSVTYHGNLFQQYIAEATIRRHQGNVNATQSVRMTPWI
ncbi:hypothetical protein KUW19_00840 [Ferrimonas balearica]|uniref:phage adaptor protein n=1 Tax=Ferrimonas balearica TaxID=44012 RepID=UPI001C984DCC|nr:hypothetical protein [Ferrimonas balearica]MBY6105023.1 hypothetical protein [Ferrimonas balearica]